METVLSGLFMRFSSLAILAATCLTPSFAFAQGLNPGVDPNPTSVQIGIPGGPGEATADISKRIEEERQARIKMDKRVVNRIAATVNGRAITSSELTYRLGPIRDQLATLYPRLGPEFNRQMAKAKKDVINDLVERELVLSDFDSQGLTMPDSVIDQEINRMIIMRANGNRDRFMQDLKKSGMTIRRLRESTKKDVILMAMRSRKYDDQEIPPTPDEINREYNKTKIQFRDLTKDQVKFKKIFIPFVEGDPRMGEGAIRTPEVQLELAELIAKEIKSGNETFEDMAKKYSKDHLAANGGDFPVTERSQLSPEFSAIIFDAREGSVVGPLIDPNGFMIVLVESKKLAPPPPLSAIKEQIDAQVRSNRNIARYRQWIDRIRSKAIIKIYI